MFKLVRKAKVILKWMVFGKCYVTPKCILEQLNESIFLGVVVPPVFIVHYAAQIYFV